MSFRRNISDTLLSQERRRGREEENRMGWETRKEEGREEERERHILTTKVHTLPTTGIFVRSMVHRKSVD